jgi:MSHA biogenesis protein MshJ
MKQRWLRLAARIDRMTLRQRVGMFAACAVLLLYVLFMAALDPLLREQARLRSQVTQQRDAILGAETQITSLVEAFAHDPDAANRRRLDVARTASRSLSESLAAMQKGMVAPEQMVPLLQSILRANGRLQLVALTTLPVSPVGGAAPLPPPSAAALPGVAATAAPSAATRVDPTSGAIAAQIAEAGKVLRAAEAPSAPTPALPMTGLLYRHGVQVTVRGSYLDMIDYMASLERLPTQLFWGEARFEVEDYPRAHVTLTLYTLSLDSKWLKL